MSNEKTKLTYEQIVCGAFLKFDVIDPIDLSLLCDEVKKKYNVEFHGSCVTSEHGMGRIIEFKKDGSFSFYEDAKRDSIDKKTNKPVKEVLEDVAGPLIKEFFDNFDMKKYNESKNNIRKEIRDKYTNGANVLLVSEREEDYQALVKAGFKHINYFKSWVLADQFFKVNNHELYKYHIFIEGKKTLRVETDVEKNIGSFCTWSNRVRSTLYCIDEQGYFDVSTSLHDSIHRRSYSIESNDYEGIINAILENAHINKTNISEREEIIFNNFEAPNKNRMNYHNIPYGLKILYLQSYGADYLNEELAKKLGLDIDKIDYHPDHNFTLERHVDQHLGEYDIIIVSHSFSKQILNYVDECNRQCNYTGKNLVLLCTYDTDGIKASGEKEQKFMYSGSNIRLKYKVAGPDAKGLEFPNDEFIVLNGEYTPYNLLIQKPSHGEDKMSNTYAILCAALTNYNKALTNARGYGFHKELLVPTTSEFTARFNAKIEARRKYKDYDETPVKDYDNMMYQVGLYLLNKENGLIDGKLDGIRIETWGDTIKIWNNYKGKDVCALMVKSGDNKSENCRLFYLQIMKGDGSVGKIMPVGFYTKAHFEQYPVNPFFRRVPDEKEMDAIRFLEERVINKLSLLNLQGLVNQFTRNSQIISKESILKLLNDRND